ncbi:hypothetical protein MMC08_008734 [Hypocenomyce scalaris]|nr:hypothetical protein [Hypocenomyce scalaris]
MGLASKIQAAGGAAPGASAGAPAGQSGAPAGYPSQGQQTSFGSGSGGFFPGSQQQQPRPGQPGATGQSSFSGQQTGQQGMQQGQQSFYPGQQGGFTGQQGQQSSYPGQQSQQGGYPGQQGQQAGVGQQQRPQGGQQSGYPGQQGQQNGFAGQQSGQYGQQQVGSQYQTQQGTQQGGGFGQGQGSASAQGLQSKIENMVRTNRLEAFYPPNKLQQVLQRLNQTDFRALSQRWNMPLELAHDLATLALYDIVIFADDSGSMIFEENGERINDLKVILARVAEVATLFDEDGKMLKCQVVWKGKAKRLVTTSVMGIVVRFMNGHVEGNGIRDAMTANNLIQQVQFTGMTPLGSSLDSKVIRPFLGGGISNRNLQKPILVITITDGEPTGEPQNTVANVIKNAKNMCASSIYGPGAIAFEFAQVGKDTKAQAFLGRLDTDPEIGKMIDATSYYELEAEEYMRRGVNLTPELWLVKLMVGAVDPTYDEQVGCRIA